MTLTDDDLFIIRVLLQIRSKCATITTLKNYTDGWLNVKEIQMKKISPRNAVLSGSKLDSIYWPLEGASEYTLFLRVKNKKGRGFSFRKIKVYIEE